MIKNLPASHNAYNVHDNHSSKSLYAGITNPTADYNYRPLSLSLSLSLSRVLTYDEGIGKGKGMIYTLESG